MTLNLKGIVMAPSLPGNIGWVEHLIRADGLFLFVCLWLGAVDSWQAAEQRKLKNVPSEKEKA